MVEFEEVDEFIFRLSKFFRTLGNANRFQILLELQENRKCVCELAKLLGLSEQSTSRQLRVLRDQDLVQAKTRNNYRDYFLKRRELIEQAMELYPLLTRSEDENGLNQQ